MLETFIPRIRGILTRPADTFREAKDDPRNDVFATLAILFEFSALMGLLLILAGLAPGVDTGTIGLISILGVLVLTPVFGIVSVILVSVWVHCCAWLAGARQPSGRTLTALAYSTVPALLFGWIPVIDPVFMLWGLVLLVPGLRECQELTTQRALLAVFIAVLPLIILLALTILMPERFSLLPNPSLSSGVVLVRPWW